ncbi:MAG TPA: hypothetical protein VFD70_30885 [Anaerolineae bacterium]|nr:hypothetical protein [Anaerolineae bacterium]
MAAKQLQSDERERLLNRYVSALGRGDLDGVGAILKVAETDAELEREILKKNEAFATSQEIEEQLREYYGNPCDCAHPETCGRYHDPLTTRIVAVMNRDRTPEE